MCVKLCYQLKAYECVRYLYLCLGASMCEYMSECLRVIEPTVCVYVYMREFVCMFAYMSVLVSV